MKTIDLDTIRLDEGTHTSPEHGHCLMEVVSMFAGEQFSDSPACVSPVLRVFGVALNDRWDQRKRQDLKRFIPLLPGTAGDGQDEARGYLALDWLIRVYTPAWLRLVPALTKDADLLAGQGPITTLDEAAAVGDMVRDAASHAAAAGDAAWHAAGAAAWGAAGAAAWDAARHAAGATAGDAAGDAARAAAGHAARDAAGHAARAAAWEAARPAAWAAAWDAAWDALAPTVAELQDSALDLYARMIDPAGATL